MAAARHRVAVVTPYHREPLSVLERCHRSVAAQRVAADHIMVADGHARDCIDGWDAAHVRLPRAHDDNGNTPRGIGSLLASSEGYDFVAYLDADNWYRDDHLLSLIDLWERSGSPVCAASRTFHDAAGDDLGIRERDEDERRHIDTSCLLIHRAGFTCLPIWLAMPKPLSPIGDRVFLAGLRHRGLAIAWSGARTVGFESRYAAHYLAAGRPMPADPRAIDFMLPALRWLGSAEGIGRCVDTLGFWPLGEIAI